MAQYFEFLSPHIHLAAPPWPAHRLPSQAALLQQFFFKFVFSVLALPPSAGYKATQTSSPLSFQMLLLLPQTCLPTFLSHFCSIFQGSLENSEGALKSLLSWFLPKLFNH